MPYQIAIKEELYAACNNFLNKSIDELKKAWIDAQHSANADNKGSAGDKHETGRAMMHLEVEKNAKQLAERMQLLKVLALIDPKEKHIKAQLGSLVETNQGNYYIAIAIGKVEVENKDFYVISPASPIGKSLMGSEKGSNFNFNAKDFVVLAIH